jgi:hypothetical protein
MELTPEWIIGFVDGEGCFHISLLSHPEKSVGFQVLPEFTVVQHERDVQILYALKKHFGFGVVRRNHGDRFCYRVRNLDGLNTICEFFMKHPLKTKKNVDFRKFRTVLIQMQRQAHLNTAGLLEILRIAKQMNSSKRERLEEIERELVSSLKVCQMQTDDTDKEMVHSGLKDPELE